MQIGKIRILKGINAVMTDSFQDDKGIWHQKPIALYGEEETKRINDIVRSL